MCFLTGPLQCVMKVKNVNDSRILTCSGMLLQSAAIVVMKLLVDDKITAFVKEISLLGVVCKVLKRKTLSGETFGFPQKRLLSILISVL